MITPSALAGLRSTCIRVQSEFYDIRFPGAGKRFKKTDSYAIFGTDVKRVNNDASENQTEFSENTVAISPGFRPSKRYFKF